MAKTKITLKDLFEKRNTSDVFNRLVILGLLKILNLQIKYTLIWEDNEEGIEEITVPFFYDFSGGVATSEKFILDNYTFFTSDECTSIGFKKLNGSFDIVPCGRLTLTSTSIESGNITNRFVLGQYNKKLNGQIKSFVSFLYSLPLTMNFNIKINCDTMNTAWKIEQAYREYFYKNKTFHINYKGTIVPVRVGFPESLNMEKSGEYTIGNALNAYDILLGFDIVCESYQPVFDPTNERPSSNYVKNFGGIDYLNDLSVYTPDGNVLITANGRRYLIKDGIIYIVNPDGTITVVEKYRLDKTNHNITTGEKEYNKSDKDKHKTTYTDNIYDVSTGIYKGEKVIIYKIHKKDLDFDIDAELNDLYPAWGLGIGLNGFLREDKEAYLVPLTNLYGNTYTAGQEILFEWRFRYNMGDLLSVSIAYIDESEPNELMIIDTVFNNNFFYWEIPNNFVSDNILFDIVIPNIESANIITMPEVKLYPDDKTRIVKPENAVIINKGFIVTNESTISGLISYLDKEEKIQEYVITFNLLNNMLNPEHPVDFTPFVYNGNIKSRRIKLFLYDHYNYEKSCCFTLNEKNEPDYITII